MAQSWLYFVSVHRNYVVQYIIELKIPSITAKLIYPFKGHFVELSMHKFSSHVVEKCLEHFVDSRSRIIHEFLSVSCFEQLLQDPYANYVIQSALALQRYESHHTSPSNSQILDFCSNIIRFMPGPSSCSVGWSSSALQEVTNQPLLQEDLFTELAEEVMCFTVQIQVLLCTLLLYFIISIRYLVIS